MEPSYEIQTGTKTPKDPSSRAPDPLLPSTLLTSRTGGAKYPVGRALFSYPSQRASHFIPRSNALREIQVLLHKAADRVTPSVVVLVGMGGCGKTQLALEHCRRGQEEQNYESIFWIEASNPSSAAQSFAKIEELIFNKKVELQDAEASVKKVIATMNLWETPWLIVFDNFDEPDLFNQKRIQEYFPQGGNGHILVTSRSKVAGKLGESIVLNAMSEIEGLDLLVLSGNIRREDNMEPSRAIVQRLGYHALALDQAGAYISARGLAPELFIKHYEKRKQKVLEETPSFWAYKTKMKLNENEEEIALNAFTTWEMSFDQIRDGDVSKKTKTHLLNVFAFFDNQNIIEDFFRMFFEASPTAWMGKPSTGTSRARIEFQRILAELFDLSLLQNLEIEALKARFSMHPLIRDWMRLKTSIQERQQYSIEVIMMLDAFLAAQDENTMLLESRRRLLPHLDVIVQNNADFLDREIGLGNSSLRTAAFRFATFYQNQGNYRKAIHLCEIVLDGREQDLGVTHIETLRTAGSLANLYHASGLWEEASRLLQHVLRRLIVQVGEDDPDTLRTDHNLALVHEAQGRYDEAVSLLQKAIEGKKKLLPEHHPDILCSMHNLAGVYTTQGKLKEAEELNLTVLKEQERQLGVDHPATLITVHSIAHIFLLENRDEEANRLYKRAMEGRRKQHGDDHPAMIKTIFGFALFHSRQGQNEVAEKMLKKALEYSQKIYDADHPHVHSIMRRLGSVCEAQGKYHEAEQFFKQALEGNERKLGLGHPETLETTQDLANLQHTMKLLASTEQDD